MKPSKLNSRLALTLAVSLTTQSTLALAGNGARDGNGSDAPEVAYTPEQIQSIQDHMNLDYLKLSPKEIQKREKKLKPIYDYYRDATAGRMIEQIQGLFGSNVYVHQDRAIAAPSLSSKEGVMAEAVRYFSDFGYRSSGSSLFHGTPASELPGEASVSLRMGDDLEALLTEGNNEIFDKTSRFQGYFQFYTWKDKTKKYGMIWDSEYNAVYSSLPENLFKFPVLDYFVSAMKDTSLKGLDATLVFTGGLTAPSRSASGDASAEPTTTRVLYPPFSKLAPIPQPIVYIAANATEDQIAEMLKSEAPKIYAYNQLFNQRILPQVQELDRALKQYPEVMESLRRANGNISEANARARLYDAYMTVTYGMIAAGLAPIALVAMLSSAVLSPVIIAAAVASPVVVVAF